MERWMDEWMDGWQAGKILVYEEYMIRYSSFNDPDNIFKFQKIQYTSTCIQFPTCFYEVSSTLSARLGSQKNGILGVTPRKIPAWTCFWVWRGSCGEWRAELALSFIDQKKRTNI